MTSQHSAPRTARAIARDLLTERIASVAENQLGSVGAQALSLRSVAHELGMAPSALYRYFPDKDHLLTALIVRGYNDLGSAISDGMEADPEADPAEHFRSVFDAIWQWAHHNPHRWGLLYGTPVPSYQAPTDTVEPAAAALKALVSLMDRQLERNRAIVTNSDASSLGVTSAVTGSAVEASRTMGAGAALTLLPQAPDLAGAIYLAITWAIGYISADLWGHLHGGVDDPEALFRAGVEHFSRMLGLSS